VWEIAIKVNIGKLNFAGGSYTLEDTALHIRCGSCANNRIPCTDIKSVKETINPLASAGLSLDRIEIQYSNGDFILIFPQDKQEFIRQLEQRTA